MFRNRGLQHWLPTYVGETKHRSRLRSLRKQQLTHLVFLVCDHYEPRHKATDPAQPAARVQAWHTGYRRMQDECESRYGFRPLHSFFYPPHHGYEHLPALAHMAFAGLGEIELHYHHENDTEETLRAALKETLARYRRAGLLLQMGNTPLSTFGFIHGDWALDNSAHGQFCGVNSELALLQELGCWADLTMPSGNDAQTRKINSIYYAVDDREKPKSHDWGKHARAGAGVQDGLLLIQGPLGINFRGPKYPRIENASLTSANWGTPARVQSWIDCHVHVEGRPEWLFIKLHTHGAVDADVDALYGNKARAMYKTLAEQYNDGKRFRMHFVTARQSYNIVRAAEAGLGGDPSQYLDYELPPQVTSRYWSTAAHDLRRCTDEQLSLEAMDTDAEATVQMRYPGVEEISGRLRSLTVNTVESALQFSTSPESTLVRVRLAPGASVNGLMNARMVGESAGGELNLACTGPVRLEYQLAPQRAAVGA